MFLGILLPERKGERIRGDGRYTPDIGRNYPAAKCPTVRYRPDSEGRAVRKRGWVIGEKPCELVVKMSANGLPRALCNCYSYYS